MKVVGEDIRPLVDKKSLAFRPLPFDFLLSLRKIFIRENYLFK